MGTWSIVAVTLYAISQMIVVNHPKQIGLGVSIALIFLMWNIIGLCLWIDVVIEGTQMLEIETILFFYFYFGMTGCLLCCISTGIVLVCIAFLVDRQNKIQAKQEYTKVIQDIVQNRDYDLEALFRTKEVMIEGIELQPVDFEWIRKKFIRKMTSQPEDEPKECVICIDEIEDGTEDIFFHPSCLHTFHWECIEEWFTKKKSCPMCRISTRKKLMEGIRGVEASPY